MLLVEWMGQVIHHRLGDEDEDRALVRHSNLRIGGCIVGQLPLERKTVSTFSFFHRTFSTLPKQIENLVAR